MKLIIYLSFLIATICSGCKNKGTEEKRDRTTSLTKQRDPSLQKKIKEISPAFTDVNPKTSIQITAIINTYLQIKNALVDNDEEEARSNGKKLDQALSDFDKSLLTSDQSKVYTAEEDEMKEDAEHIGKSKIDHQREHFSILSQSIYTIVKAFGSQIPLYHIYCEEVQNGQGAMWLSETKEIKNPYLDKKMPDCGIVKEEIK